ncbi:MAG: capsular biosynthesis protein [Gammaproteobacteria bacterium]|nr:capsular biosynthesis protein [Gammaproteobacteria bacterium]
MSQRQRHFAFARLLSSAVISQGLLSIASFSIGLILIRSTTDVQYGYYILASNAILLLASLQNAFFNPPLSIRLNRLDSQGRGQLVGGLYREQRRIFSTGAAVTVVLALVLWYIGVLDVYTGPLVLATVAATLAFLHREYFRMVLFAHRRPQDVLRTDVFYVLLTVVGVSVAVLTPAPAVTAVFMLSVAALVSGVFLARTLHRREPWDMRGAPGILREIVPLAMWSTGGAAIHWAFSQGYIYLVAGTLDVAAVAAIGATRLLLMPMNLLSTGIGSLMLPLSSTWLHQHGASVLWRRLCLLALGLALAMVCYFAVLWWLRDWIYAVVLKKQFAQRDALLILWGVIFLMIVVRDQLVYLLAAQARFRVLTLLTLASAVVSLGASYVGMLRFGVAGALLGIVLGELINVIGIVILSFRTGQDPLPAPA